MKILFSLYPLVPMMSSSVMEPDGNNMTSSECPAGEELMGDSCTACRSGFYKDQTGNGTCTRCPPNTDTNGRTGSTQCSEYFKKNWRTSVPFLATDAPVLDSWWRLPYAVSIYWDILRRLNTVSCKTSSELDWKYIERRRQVCSFCEVIVHLSNSTCANWTSYNPTLLSDGTVTICTARKRSFGKVMFSQN